MTDAELERIEAERERAEAKTAMAWADLRRAERALSAARANYDGAVVAQAAAYARARAAELEEGK